MATASTYGKLSATQHSAELRKAVIAATVGTTIEWYDFFIYGTAAGLVFPKLYFPNEDPLTGTLLAFSTYFIGFVGRPIGAAIFGHYGDRIGRKATLIATLLLMGIATVPRRVRAELRVDRHLGRHHPDRAAHAARHRRRRRMGRLGPDLDGMGAHPRQPRARRLVAAIRRAVRACSWRTSPSSRSAPGRVPISSTWGWRVPFLLSIVLIGIGLWIRLGILETPVFRQLVEDKKIERAPIFEVIRKQPREIILCALLRMAEQAPFYIFTAFVFAYGTTTLKMSRDLILFAVLAASCLSFVTIPLSGHISDRIGRRKMYLIGAAVTGLFGFLYFGMLDTAIPSAVFIAIVLSLIPHDMQYGPQAALIAESFTPRLRYSGASLGYQLASVIAGGPAPLIATALFAAYHTGYAIAIYIAACAVISLVSAGLDAGLHRQGHLGGIRRGRLVLRRHGRLAP